MCIFQALSKCKTAEEKIQVFAAMKAITESVEKRRNKCLDTGKHTWAPEPIRPLKPMWQCEICHIVTFDKDKADQRLTDEINSKTNTRPTEKGMGAKEK